MNACEIRVQRLNETPFGAKLDAPAHVMDYWHEVITRMPWFIPEREICVAIMLNTKLNVTGHSLVSVGSLNETTAYPRECFRAAVAMNAFAVVIAHNHPSGDPAPSDADHRLTHRLREAGSILLIALMDHIIIGDGRWFSFKEAGLV